MMGADDMEGTAAVGRKSILDRTPLSTLSKHHGV